ncbi:transaldolase [Gleimia hominis]|uniref:Transaldolase n=1 Tax=Gleimia hominis TaxID=595468 RepID=A0ABU3IEH9_9ACTO|nr:transaldolase [Gleimia hominis]MDT3767645.1 transaldolase [Gleimia hominis]
MSEKLQRLSKLGVSIWLDDLSRKRLRTGDLQERIDQDCVVGVTTNPAIFSKAIGNGQDYTDQVRQLAAANTDVDEATFAMIIDDVRDAADVLMPIYDRTHGQDGRVSIEVDPRLSAKTTETIEQAQQLWDRVDRPNTMIKIPATQQSLPAVTEATARGISVNVTLIFSVPQYRKVIDAYLQGLEEALERGIDISQIHSVASFFVSRVDTLVDSKLDELGTDAAAELRSRLGVANARLAYEEYENSLTSDRWKALAAVGANRQRPLWASTGVKDPKLPETLYVDELAVQDTVNTMPEATLRAAAEQSQAQADAVTTQYSQAHACFDALAKLGIDFDAVAAQLLDEGVEKFEVAWNELLENVQAALTQAK